MSEPDFEFDDARTFNPAAGVAAWVFPGLGHIIRGEKRRGRLIMLGVLFLVITGLLVGGVDCVDRKQDRLWFLAQVVCGPVVLIADAVNQHYVQKLPDDQRYAAIALNKPNEMGTLFVALAGLMNLVVILDALSSPRRREFIERRAPRKSPHGSPHGSPRDVPGTTSTIAGSASGGSA